LFFCVAQLDFRSWGTNKLKMRSLIASIRPLSFKQGVLMRIAQIAPLAEAVPPKLYGGTERVVSHLTEELVRLGHDVTLFASGGSFTSAKLEAVWPNALRLDGQVKDVYALHAVMFEQVARRVHEFDLLHFHVDYHPFSLFSRLGTPFVTTFHGRLDLPELKPVFAAFPHIPVISISNEQRRPVTKANWVGTVHHGLPEDLLQPKHVKPSYFAFLGRASPEKGLDKAIAIAKACAVPLKIAAKVDKADAAYFECVLSPLLAQPGIEFIGEIGDAEKAEFLSGAFALLMPIAWPEPFGIVMIEAMACGTPVLAFKCGSVPEVVANGVTGYIVNSIEEAVEAAAKLSELSRQAIREHFEHHFTSDRMAREYMKIYRALIESKARKARLVNGSEARASRRYPTPTPA
jgi:glycosyltransferase involved in cell wall biosynthesis